MEEHILRRLIYVKSLLAHGAQHAELENPTDTAFAILHFDNSMEMLLHVILEFLGARNDRERRFDELISCVREAIKAKEPGEDPDKLLRAREIRNLHSARNNIQHVGVIPAADEAKRYLALTEAVMRNVGSKLFGIDFSKISLGILIKDEKVRRLFLEGDKALSNGDFLFAALFFVCAFETAKTQEQDRIYGSGLTFSRVSKESVTGSLKNIVEYVDKLTEEIEIMKLRLDYKKYQKYREFSPDLTPFLRIVPESSEIDMMASKVRETLKGIDQVDQSDLREYANFCSNFVVESILRWESVQRKAWYE